MRGEKTAVLVKVLITVQRTKEDKHQVQSEIKRYTVFTSNHISQKREQDVTKTSDKAGKCLFLKTIANKQMNKYENGRLSFHFVWFSKHFIVNGIITSYHSNYVSCSNLPLNFKITGHMILFIKIYELILDINNVRSITVPCSMILNKCSLSIINQWHIYLFVRCILKNVKFLKNRYRCMPSVFQCI